MLKSRVGRSPDFGRMAEAVSRPGIDPRCWVSTAYVSAFTIDEEGPRVDVILMPSEQPEVARVATEYAGPGFGFYVPVDVDDEVLVGYPNGDPEEGLVVLRKLWSKSDTPPAGAIDDPTCILLHAKEDCTVKIKATGAGTVIVEAPSVLIQNEGGSPQELAYKSDVEAVASAVNGHTHLGVPHATSTTGPMTAIVPSPTGTSVLKAE